MTPAPDVSIVVIVYNDADRLPRAVDSLLAQTLDNIEVLIVDDASTDHSFSVAESLAAQNPDKVSAMRLPENSGGCSRPRNVGIDAARGTYVMFLDSDDTLDRHACKNMLAAAEETGADLVSGLCVRLHVDKQNKMTKWYPHLYEQHAVYESLSEQPDLLYDTLSTNKCYRRDFLNDNALRFPEGYHYEDLLFSAQAYLAAERIALVPYTVYYWHVIDKTDAKSISNRRDEIGNFVDRIRIHKLIDRQLVERLPAEQAHLLKVHKDKKFVKHDLVLYLWGLPFQDETYRREFLALAKPYVETLDRSAFLDSKPIPALAAYLIMRDDWDNLLPALDTVLNPNKLATELHREGERVYWCADHLDDELGRQVLDVTDTLPWSKPLFQTWFGNRLTSFRSSGSVLTMSGEINNALGRLDPQSAIAATLEFRARRKKLAKIAVRVPVTTVRHEGSVLTWTSEFDLAEHVRPIGLIDPVWDVRLQLRVDGEITSTRLFATSLPEGTTSIPIRPRLSRLAGDNLLPHLTSKGHLAFAVVSESELARKSQELMLRSAHSPLGHKAIRSLKDQLKQGKARKKSILDLGKRTLSQLPVHKGTIVFESHLGQQYSDNPKYIYEELRRSGIEINAIWSYSGSTEGFPKDAKLVKRHSWAYYKALAQAEFWIDNQGFPADAVKNKGTTYIQTWHGSALKRMGFDIPTVKQASEAERDRLQTAVDRFDHFVVRSEHDVRTLVAAYRLRAEILRVGYPRNDALVDPSHMDDELTRLRTELGLDADDTRRVLLYAPTFRQAPEGSIMPFEMPFDLERFAERFGDRYVLLIRTHYRNTVEVPPSLAAVVRDASRVHDITPLLLLADALVTDYSSMMFDYALLARPLVLFTYDYDEYTGQSRGAYFDLAEHAPGPLVHDEDALFEVLDDLDATQLAHADRRQRFVEEFGEYDTGTAAKAIVERFFGPGGTA
ncbi:bifunctional glycosyltransferase/CDP-glycerol:glycerophosphate glycerophosphotransferase [Embleya scabrispora]|uniref:bifunctional glycosyltransferase/CDP-glycerol:glycerophosphate glycerophosphotransferase n=1 Tax=Embleya scabrispora TaxID=159449 RepID=UPI00036D2A68|nr:CDP-glycerol glycerophosphotransferase family protein [Embleya scabrispora]MYS79941.1 glycosyltransferase [Streptomyces sp. SID5474]